MLNGGEEFLVSVTGHTAHAKALDDERVDAWLEEAKDLRRRARHQLQIKNALVELPVKGGPGLHLRLIEVAQHAAIAHGGQLGIVYALEGVHALGAHLAGARAGDHAAVKDHAKRHENARPRRK